MSVTVLSRSPVRARRVLPAAVKVIERLEDATGVNAVINLAGENLAAGRWTAKRKRAIIESRLATTRRVVDWIAAQERKPEVLISGSAVGWYGPRGDELLDERASPGSDFPAQLCRSWENEAEHASGLGVRVCCVRIGIVVALQGGAVARMLLPFRLGLGGRLGDGRQWMSWIALSDIVRLICWLAENSSARGTYNGTAPLAITNAEFTRALARVLHRPARMPVPAFVLKMLLGEMADLLLTGQRVAPARAVEQGFVFESEKVGNALSAGLAGLTS